jgi:hypothetical protein
MSAQRWRRWVIVTWAVLACIGLFVMGLTPRTVSFFVVCGVVPPAMLLWLWNEDRPLVMGSLSPRKHS